MTSLVVPLGILLPGDFLASEFFGVLAVFVAINTVAYVALAVAKVLPRIHLADLSPRRYQRSETRSIHPDGPV